MVMYSFYICQRSFVQLNSYSNICIVEVKSLEVSNQRPGYEQTLRNEAVKHSRQLSKKSEIIRSHSSRKGAFHSSTSNFLTLRQLVMSRLNKNLAFIINFKILTFYETFLRFRREVYINFTNSLTTIYFQQLFWLRSILLYNNNYLRNNYCDISWKL